MHRVEYEERIALQDGQIVRLVTARWRDLELLVYKELEDGTAYCRNVYLTSIGGYMVAFPGERISQSYSYYGSQTEVLQEWHETRHLPIGKVREITEEEKNLILKKYPAFVYLFKKFHFTTATLFDVMPIWRKHPDVEFLLQIGASQIVNDKRFFKFTKEKQKTIIKWLLVNKDVENPALSDVLYCIKWNIPYCSLVTVKNECSYHSMKLIAYDIYQYLKDIPGDMWENNRTYRDYLSMAKEAGHNTKDNYWKWPKNLRAAHVKVLDEVNAINRLKELETLKATEEQLKDVVEQYSCYNATVGGYRVFITMDMATWQRQAEVLHQCIIRCKYYQPMIERKKLIVFIQKNDIPVATAELYPNKVIGQFYANEIGGPAHSKPTKEVENIFNKWLDTLPGDLLNEKKKKLTA